MSNQDEDQSRLPHRRLKAADGIDIGQWASIQVGLASQHFQRLEPLGSGVLVHAIEGNLPDWIRCAYTYTMTTDRARDFACGTYAHYLIAVCWDDAVYGNYLYPSCRDHLPFLVDQAQVARDQIENERAKER